jgi:hypothetical protein
MADEQLVKLLLTPEQRKQIRQATGKSLGVLKLPLELLSEEAAQEELPFKLLLKNAGLRQWGGNVSQTLASPAMEQTVQPVASNRVTAQPQKCMRCRGTGKVSRIIPAWKVHSFLGRIGAIPPRTVFERCPSCKGSGWIS